MLHQSHLVICAVLSVAILSTNAEQANQLDFAARPVSHSPEYYCCKYSETTMEIYTKYNRPMGGSYEDYYRKGWNEGRRVNYPYRKFTPSSPTYYYDEPSSVCRMHVVVTDFSTGAMTYELQCASSNTTLEEDSQDATVFWASPSNSRNNNASFPIGAQCTSLMDVDGQVNATAKAACASLLSTVTPQFTTLDKAEFVHLFKHDDTEVLLADRSGVSALVQRIESIFTRKNNPVGYQQTVPVKHADSLRLLEFQNLRYIYDDTEKCFVPGVVALAETHRDILHDANGLSTSEAERRLQTVGTNAMDVVMPSIAISVIQEFFTLFYIYQIMCYYVWYYFTYWNLGIVMTMV
ncbi:hypothetical protein JM18_009565, partial [Phytophthora kernoviae]